MYRAQQHPNTLDLIITNEEGMVDNLSLSAPVGKSHHVCIHFDFTSYTEAPSRHVPKFRFHKGDYTGMREEAQKLTWYSTDDDTLEEKWHIFKNNVKYLMDKFIPKSRPNQKKRPIFMNTKATEEIKEKKKTFQRWRETCNPRDYKKYTKARNQVKWECRRAERDFEQKLALESKQNPKAFYRYAQSKLKTRSAISQLLQNDGSLTTSDKDKANVLNSFFTSVFTREDMTNMPEQPEQHPVKEMDSIVFTLCDVAKKLERLNPNKSPGPDGMHPKVLRELSTALAEPLYAIFTQSMNTGKLPKDWKMGHVSPIYKKGSRNQAKNYRPVSLTSVVCTTMESLIRDKFMDHLINHELLTSCQHGFMKGRSCVTQLLAVLDEWTEAMEQGSDIDCIYLDFSKAFDSVPHQRLLMKLRKFGISEKNLSWTRAFLLGREQLVTVNGELSRVAAVLSGIPQGSVLGPLLFICFVNDMPNVVHSHIQMFADDTKLYCEVNNMQNAHDLQKDLTALESWTATWQFNFNAEKCKVMHLGTSNSRYTYHMMKEGQQIDLQITELEKDLGIHMDPKLTHIVRRKCM